MASITDIVTRSFESGRDFRQTYNISERGASSLLTGVYNKTAATDRGFYKKPELAEGEETKLAILYGEIMITPYILDIGITGGAQDPASITRTIRFIAGDGETEGIVTGPNGSPLENVYMGSPDGSQPIPVVNEDGRSSTKDIVLASALGGAITSIPSIWNAISDAVPSTSKVGAVDPVTGKLNTSIADKAQQNSIGKNLPLEGLSNVVDLNGKGDGYVLVWDNCSGVWTPRSINDLLADQASFGGVTGGEGGTGGTGGDGGQGGQGGTGGAGGAPSEPIPPPKAPDDDLTKASCQVTGSVPFVELPDWTETPDNEVKVDVNIFNVEGIQLHFYLGGLGLKKKWAASNADDPTNADFPCLQNPNTPSNPGTQETIDPGTVLVNICITVNVCGKDFKIYDEDVSWTGLSTTSFTRATQFIMWENTELAMLYPWRHQIFTKDNRKVKVRVKRMDGEATGCPTSGYPIAFQGIKFQHGDYLFKPLTPAEQEPTNYATITPTVGSPQTIDDDGQEPDLYVSGATGPSTCPEDPENANPGKPGGAGGEGESGSGGGSGSPGSSGEVEIAPPPAIPELYLEAPFNITYCPDSFGYSFPEYFPFISSAGSGITNTIVTVTYSIVSGMAAIFIAAPPSPPLPPGITTTGDATRTFTMTGDASLMRDASSSILLSPDPQYVGEIQFKISIKNADGGCSGGIYKAIPCGLAIASNFAACGFIIFNGDTEDTGTAQVFMDIPNSHTSEDVINKQITSGPVSKTVGQTLDAFVSTIATNINNNVIAHANEAPGSANWLPALIVTADGPKLNICGPIAGGESFNALGLSANTTGGIGTDEFASFKELAGGITKNVSDFFIDNPLWGAASDVLLGIAGNVAGAVATNILLNDSSSVEITIPEADKDVSIAFLYRGRKVQMPNEYNPATRTGATPYANFSGTWKTAWTDNPAWCLLDFIQNKKFGLGSDIEMVQYQLDLLYNDIFNIAMYCDEVTDGKPRFSLNTAITDGTKIQILEQLCSVFFGSYAFHKGGLRIRADQPYTDIKLLVNQANADTFVYEHTTLRSFFNKVEVTYIEPSNFYTEEIVIAENTQGIERYGEKVAKVVAFGITNSDQALRYANWLLLSEQENALTISYVGGWDHYRLVPGDIVQFDDSSENLIRMGGRVKSVTGTNVKTDGATDAQVGDGISITQNDGTIFTSTIITMISDSEFTIQNAPPKAVMPYSTFIAFNNPQLFRVVSVDETSDGKYNTTLQLYNLDKYSKIQATTRMI